MKIIQCSVIKDACRPEYWGGINSLFSGTADIADGYVVGVDNSSEDGTYDAAGRALEKLGKPFELYGFDWPEDFSAAMNTALERADGMGADWYLRLDGDSRFALTEGVREYVSKCKKDTVFSKSFLTKVPVSTTPPNFIRAGSRFDGLVYETLEYPHPMLFENMDVCPSFLLHFRDDFPAIQPPWIKELAEREAERLQGLIPKAKTGEENFRLAERFYELGCGHLNKHETKWLSASIALCKKAKKMYYHPGECNYMISSAYERMNDYTKKLQYSRLATQSVRENVERLRTRFDLAQELHDSVTLTMTIHNALGRQSNSPMDAFNYALGESIRIGVGRKLLSKLRENGEV